MQREASADEFDHVILILVLALLIAGLFTLAMIEASLLHVRRSAVAAHIQPDDRQGRQLLRLLDDLPSVMNSVLLAVLALQVTAASIAGILAQRWVGGAGVTIATVAITTVLFVYGEAIPKTIAISDPERYARTFSRVSTLLSTVLTPVVWVLTEVARWQSPRRKRIDTVTGVSEVELLHLTGEAAAAGRIDLSDAELIRKSFILGDLSAADIMTPIDHVVSIAGSTPVCEALRIAIEVGHRRIPVHSGQPDQLIGFVRLRDLAEGCTVNPNQFATQHVRPAVTTVATALAIEVLRNMQLCARHFAIVADDGGTALGIVTVEDVVEELLGEIDEPHPLKNLWRRGEVR